MIPSPPFNSFSLGPLTIYFYGITMALAVSAAYFFISRKAKQKGFTEEMIDRMFFVVVPVGFVCARIYHVLAEWSYYSQNPGKIVAVWEGGIGIIGGVIGGALAFWLLSKYYLRKSFLELTDIVVLGVALGQTIGRWGNYFNQELYGKPTDVPWGLVIDRENRLTGYERFSTFHPLFLYESILNFFNFLVLFWVSRRIGVVGITSGLYLVNYGIIRLLMESLRLDTEPVVWVLKPAQWLSIGLIIVGCTILLRVWSFSSKR